MKLENKLKRYIMKTDRNISEILDIIIQEWNEHSSIFHNADHSYCNNVMGGVLLITNFGKIYIHESRDVYGQYCIDFLASCYPSNKKKDKKLLMHEDITLKIKKIII